MLTIFGNLKTYFLRLSLFMFQCCFIFVFTFRNSWIYYGHRSKVLLHGNEHQVAGKIFTLFACYVLNTTIWNATYLWKHLIFLRFERIQFISLCEEFDENFSRSFCTGTRGVLITLSNICNEACGFN